MKQKIEVARVHEKVLNKRNDFLHRLSRQYVEEYGFIAVEDLNVKGIVEISWNACNVMNSFWNRFVRMLSYKAEGPGKIVVEVEVRGTQRCSGCGVEVKKSL